MLVLLPYFEAQLNMTLQVVSVRDQMEPFCQQHIRPVQGRFWDAISQYPNGITDHIIFTDAPQQYNTVLMREKLAAAALLGSDTKHALVHAVLEKHCYILTLDYLMKMLHLEVRVHKMSCICKAHTCHCAHAYGHNHVVLISCSCNACGPAGLLVAFHQE